MSDTKDPTNAELLTALQGMWRQQKDLVQGLEGRLGAKVEVVARDVDLFGARLGAAEERVETRLGAAEARFEARLRATEERLGERLAREIQDRPVVVHIDMSRVTDLERQLAELAKRVADLEERGRAH